MVRAEDGRYEGPPTAAREQAQSGGECDRRLIPTPSAARAATMGSCLHDLVGAVESALPASGGTDVS